MATIQDKLEAFRRGDKQSGTGTRQNNTPKTNISPEEYKRMMQEAMDSGGYGTIQPYEKNKGVQKSTPSFNAPVMGGYDTVLPYYQKTDLIEKYSPKIEQTIAGAVNESAAGIGGFLGGITGNEALQKFGVDKSRKGQEYLAQAKEGLGTLGRGVVDLGALGTQLLVDAAAGPASMLALFARSAGSGYNAAEEAGVDGLKKHLYALGSGAIEAVSEKISGGIPVFGKGAIDNVIAKLGKTTKGKAVLSFLGSAAGEGLEEVVANTLQVPLQQLTINPDAKFDSEWLAETAYQGLLGSIMGGAFGAPKAIATATKRAPQEVAQALQNGKKVTKEEVDALVEDIGVRVNGDNSAMGGALRVPGALNGDPVAAVNQYNAEKVEAAQEETVVNDNPAEHTPEEQARIEEYKNSVDLGLLEFVEMYENNKNAPFARYDISAVSGRQVADLQALTGVDFSNYTNAISKNGVNHIIKGHGKAGDTDRSMKNSEDISRVGYVINNYDSVDWVYDDDGKIKRSSEYIVNGVKAPLIKYSKKINGTYYVVEAAMEAKAKKLWVVSAYIDKNSGTVTQTLDAEAPRTTPEAISVSPNSAVSDNIISEQRGNINSDQQIAPEYDMPPVDDVSPEQAEPQQAEPKQNNYESELFDLKVKYGMIPPGENPYRKIELPKQTSETERVSQTVRTILEAEVTPDVMVPDIEKLVADGTLSRKVYGDKKAVADAERTIKNKGFSAALGDWLNDSRKGVMNKKHTTLGWVLYNQAATAGDTSAAMTILVEATENQHNAGQALQATKILKKLSPESRLYAVVKQARKISSNLKAKAVKNNEHDEVLAGVENEAKKEVETILAKDKTLGWAKGTRDMVATAIERRLKGVSPKEKTITDYVRGDILRAITGKIPAIANKPTMTERLAELLNNKNKYKELWDDVAREFLAYHEMDEFAGATADVVKEVFTRAIVESAIDEDITLQNMVARVELGDRRGIENQIFARLNSKIGFSGTDAKIAKNAISAYVDDALTKSKKTGVERIQIDVKKQMKEIGTSISEILQGGFSDRAEVKDKIANALIGKYNIDATVANEAASGIFVNIDLLIQEAAGKKLETMFADRPPKERKDVRERFENLIKLGAFTSSYDIEAAKKLFGDGIVVNQALAEKFLAAETEEERDTILYDMYKDIGSQMPASFREKYDAWRYNAMLANPRTHIRNVFGNAFFVPVVGAKNIVATGLERVVYAASGGKLGRTKSLRDKELFSAAKGDFDNIADIAMSSGKYEDIMMNKAISEGRTIFKSKLLEKLRRWNSDLLSKEDRVFTKRHYASALAQYCKANGITAKQIQDGKIPDAAREYAIKEAQKATYRDANAVSQFMANVGRHRGSNPVAKTFDLLLGGVLPFRKTPANILVRGLEYSPAGLLKAGVDVVRKGLGSTEKFERFGTDKSGAEIIDEVAAGLTGSALLGLGVLFASMGVLRGAGDDDEEQRKFDELQGHQDYSLEIGDGSVTLDWLAPEILPIMVGANIWEVFGDDADDNKMAGVITALSQISDPLLNLSCLQGINDLLDSTAYAANEGVGSLPKILASMVTSYITQAIPTVMGQAERSTEEHRMTTYTDKNQWLTTDMQYTLGKMAAKIPVWEYGQIPYIDAWGRPEDSGGAVARVANNFLNPAYTSKVDTNALEQELQRLYDATGDGKVLPDRADKKIVIESETKHLTEDEYVRYAVFKGQESLAQVNSLIQTTAYKAADDVTKADMVADAYDYANAIAKTRVSNYKLKGWYKKASEGVGKAGLPVAQYIIAKNIAGDLNSEDENGNTVAGLKKYRVCEAINNMQITVPQKDYLYLTVGDYSEKTLRDTPWHGGRVSYGDGGSSSSNRSVTGSFKGYSKTTNNSGYRGDINNRFKNKSKF